MPSITDYNILAADGVTDASVACIAALAAIPASETLPGGARSAGGGEVYFPPHAAGGRYLFKARVDIPANKNVSIVLAPGVIVEGEGIDHVFFRRADSVFKHFSVEGDATFLDVGCALIENQSRGQHVFRGFQVINSPHYGITLMSGNNVTEQNPYGDIGGSGGIVNGIIDGIRFTDCYGAVQCRGHQSDNWLITSCESVRSQKADFQIFSASWRLTHGSCEQRASVNDGGDYTHPWVNIGFSTAVASCMIFDWRFGNEFADYAGTDDDTQPPREAIVFGVIGESNEGHTPNMRVVNCYFRGHAGGATDTSANAAIRLNCGLERSAFYGNEFFGYNECLVQFAHGNNHDGKANRFDIHSEGGYVSNRETPLFNREPAQGQDGSWSILPRTYQRSSYEEVEQLLRNIEAAENSQWWGETRVTVAKDVVGPDGLANSAYTLTKTASGSAAITNNPRITTLADAWEASTGYTVGELVTADTNLYECTVAGTSAASGGPTGSKTSLTDGSVTWEYISPNQWVTCYAWVKRVPGSAIKVFRMELSGVPSGDSFIKLEDTWKLHWFSVPVNAISLAFRIGVGKEEQPETGTMLLASPGVITGRGPPVGSVGKLYRTQNTSTTEVDFSAIETNPSPGDTLCVWIDDAFTTIRHQSGAVNTGEKGVDLTTPGKYKFVFLLDEWVLVR